MRKGAYFTLGERHFSYSTCIRDLLPDGCSLGNVTHYSTTTSCHQNYAGSHQCDVTVDNVPQNTENLAEWYAQQPAAPAAPAARRKS